MPVVNLVITLIIMPTYFSFAYICFASSYIRQFRDALLETLFKWITTTTPDDISVRYGKFVPSFYYAHTCLAQLLLSSSSSSIIILLIQ